MNSSLAIVQALLSASSCFVVINDQYEQSLTFYRHVYHSFRYTTRKKKHSLKSQVTVCRQTKLFSRINMQKYRQVCNSIGKQALYNLYKSI